MRILLTVKEYAKQEGLSEQAIRKQVASKLCQSIIVDKITYIIIDDTTIKKLKQNIKNKNSQIRELKLKLEVKNSSDNDRYIQELEKQNKKLEEELINSFDKNYVKELNKQIDKLETKLEKKNKKIDKLQDQKDTMYEKFLGTLINSKKSIEH